MKSIDSEKQLLECFVATNDPDAFAVLIDRHGPMVLAVCRNVLNRQHDVEDAFQDTFLALARGAHAIKHKEHLSGWLRQVAIHMALRARSASRRRFHERNRTDYRTAYLTDPPDLSLIPLLREEVSRLPVNCRLPVVLVTWRGKATRRPQLS